jgi:hypothetical protein
VSLEDTFSPKVRVADSLALNAHSNSNFAYFRIDGRSDYNHHCCHTSKHLSKLVPRCPSYRPFCPNDTYLTWLSHLWSFCFIVPVLVWGPPAIRLGFIGAPISTAISFNVIALATATYIMFFDPRKAWHPLTRSIFQNLGILVRLGAAGVGMLMYRTQNPFIVSALIAGSQYISGQLAAEWWGWELIGRMLSNLNLFFPES